MNEIKMSDVCFAYKKLPYKQSSSSSSFFRHSKVAFFNIRDLAIFSHHHHHGHNSCIKIISFIRKMLWINLPNDQPIMMLEIAENWPPLSSHTQKQNKTSYLRSKTNKTNDFSFSNHQIG